MFRANDVVIEVACLFNRILDDLLGPRRLRKLAQAHSLGPADNIDRVTVFWPSGTVSTLERPKTRKTYVVVEPRDGDGQATATTPGNARQ